MSERISMREASRTLGVSQIRVRELIRKGTLQAEKVVEDGSERWAILTASVHQYLITRPQKAGSDGRTAESGGQPSPSEPLTVLLTGLEDHLQRVRELIKELTKAQSYLDGLRSTQSALESEVARLRSVATETSSGAATDGAQTEAAATIDGPVTEEPKARPKPKQPSAGSKPEEPKDDAGEKAAEPKAKPPKAKASTARNTTASKKKSPATKTRSAPDTALAAALFDAGIEPKPAKGKKATKKKS